MKYPVSVALDRRSMTPYVADTENASIERISGIEVTGGWLKETVRASR
jgi:hypothetical protein